MTSQLAADAGADDTVRRTVDALARGKEMTRGDVAIGIGMPRATFYRKIKARGTSNAFTAGEVALLASFLGVDIGDLYDGLGGTFSARLTPVPDPETPAQGAELATLTEQKRSRARGGPEVTRAYPNLPNVA